MPGFQGVCFWECRHDGQPGTSMLAIQNINLMSLLDGDELDALTQPLAALPALRQAFWSPSTTE